MKSKLPLDGLLVIDFTRVLAGPLCTQTLADAGARVIKIEERGRGDETRRWGPPFVNGVSAYFLSVNRNKESLTLDLKSAEGRKIARQLMSRADVVIDNFLPRQRKEFGLDRRAGKRVVHCSITGYDADTPDYESPGYDLLAQAGSGLMAITGPRDGEPTKAGVALADVLTGHYATSAILSALVGRERTGRGERIEVSIFGSALASLVNVAQAALVTNKEARRHGNEHPSIVPYQLFHASDRPFVIGAGTDRHFSSLCAKVLGHSEWSADERFATNAARVENRAQLVPLLEEEFGKRTAAQWVARCRKANVPAAIVQGVREALQSPAGERLLVDISHAQAGDITLVGNPLRFAGRRLPVRTAPPLLGEHTDAILRELGYSRAAITRLRQRDII